jgi:hypothetical protein
VGAAEEEQGMGDSGWIVRVFLVGSIALTGMACSPEPGAQVAERIRASGSTLVYKVDYRPRNILDQPLVHVFLRDGTTLAEADRFWCEVVEPAGGSHFYDEGTAVAILNESGTLEMAIDTTCGATPSPE